ncbi:hypothetical protein ACS0TY_011976 [Phlomoides rotata]
MLRLLAFCRGCGIVGHTTAACTRGRRPDKTASNEGRSQRRPSSRRDRSKSRQRGDQPLDQPNFDFGQNNFEDDVLHATSDKVADSSGGGSWPFHPSPQRTILMLSLICQSIESRARMWPFRWSTINSLR